ncbi:FkbM family methyltransferase [Brevundimonas intermedia]|uniref:FkbM family methyltransferase n=1 Tax=Brevundimonas intermedia TaxID=74315 RepID=A0A4Y9RS51_9CAUL|nr:FkbM family methyltransferase [Brevundimonas intermedia]TFW11713.1 FkbM family methyltransferase [Brevundimonas intermedia]
MAKWPARIAHLLRSDIAKGVTVKVERPHYFYLGDNLALTKLTDGHFIYVDPKDESVCAHLISRGEWEPWIWKVVVGLVQPGDRVVEVGGHVGFYTLALAQRVGPDGRITTFEANPRLVALAARSVRFNGYDSRVDVVHRAVSDKAGQLRFSTSRQFGGGGHISLKNEKASEDSEIFEIESVRLDDHEFGQVALLRIDAEGSEALILSGAEVLLSQPDIVICMEWDLIQLRSRSKPENMLQSLTEKGFLFWRISFNSQLEPIEASKLLATVQCDVIVARRMPSLNY